MVNEIYIIDPFKATDPHFAVAGMVDAYKSCLWDVQLYGLGYFQLIVPATDYNIANLTTGRMLVRDVDVDTTTMVSETLYHNAMIIRRTELSYNPDEGYMLTISGKSVKDILSQRIIWHQISMTSASLVSLIYNVLYQNVVDPYQFCANKMATIADQLEDLNDEKTQLISDKAAAFEAWQRAVNEFGEDSPQAHAAWETYEAFSEELEDKNAEIDAKTDEYNEWLRQSQAAVSRKIPYTDAGIIDIDGWTPPTVTVQLHGENIGEWMEGICTEQKLGWYALLSSNSISFGFVVGNNKTQTVIFSPEFDNLKSSTYIYSTENYKNSGQVGGEGEGTNQKTQDVGVDSPESPSRMAMEQYRYEMYIDGSGVSSNGEVITNLTYMSMLRQFGKTELMNYPIIRTFEGEIETNGVFKIGVDYDIGDYVTVSNEKGITTTTRLIETIDTDEENGYTTTATFEEMEVS